MDAEWLRSRLESGRSIESIAREAGKHPSTVGYWVNKHGLVSAHANRHGARGPLDADQLKALVEEGRSIRQIAGRLDRSPATIQHWLRAWTQDAAGPLFPSRRTEAVPDRPRVRHPRLDRVRAHWSG